jgi:hypothetical protein
MIRVYGARDITEAQFVMGLLEAEEIQAVIQSGALQAVLGEVPVTPESLPSIWVNPADADRAMTIINELNKGGPAAIGAGPSWTCPKCGEVLEGQFTSCWHCGTERPAPASAE